jgi:ferredoxin-NADP reductase
MAVTQKMRCRVERIVDNGEQVYIVDLKPERILPRFRSGQFLHLALDDYDPSGFWPESRVFSIASSPSVRDNLRIAYSVKGRFTSRMEKELMEGRQFWIKLPYGDFFVARNSDVVLFAGGTGITAYTAFLETLTSDIKHHVYLAYGARFRNLLIYRDMIERRAQQIPNFHVSYFIEDDKCEYMLSQDPQRPFKQGRLSAAAMWSCIRDPFQGIFYLSGPPLMIKTLSEELWNLGIHEEKIKIDAWE